MNPGSSGKHERYSRRNPPFSLDCGDGRGNMQVVENRDVMKKAVGYARRSTDRQEQSLEDQQRFIEAYAEQHGYQIIRWFRDDAISGCSSIHRHRVRYRIGYRRW